MSSVLCGCCAVTMCECDCRVQMSDLSSFQTTSFHTRLSFLDEENDDTLLEDEEDEEDDEERGEEYYYCGPTGRWWVCVPFALTWIIKLIFVRLFFLQRAPKTRSTSTSPSSSTAPPQRATFLPSRRDGTMSSALNTPPETSCLLWPRSRVSTCPVSY